MAACGNTGTVVAITNNANGAGGIVGRCENLAQVIGSWTVDTDEYDQNQAVTDKDGIGFTRSTDMITHCYVIDPTAPDTKTTVQLMNEAIRLYNAENSSNPTLQVTHGWKLDDGSIKQVPIDEAEVDFEIYATSSSVDEVKRILEACIAAGKTTITVKGTELATYDTGSDTEAKTVLGQAINQLTSGTISLVLPEATSLGNYAFRGCTALTSVEFPAATSIGTSAFRGCTALTSVEFPAVTTIGDYAFEGCTDLTNVEFPAATTIGNNAFEGCAALTSVEFPAVTTIENCAFQRCTALTIVKFPAATEIGIYIFRYCSSLTSLTFKSVITNMNPNAFYEASTSSCDLVLAAGQEHMGNNSMPNGTPVTAADASAEASARTWAKAEWKSITLTGGE